LLGQQQIEDQIKPKKLSFSRGTKEVVNDIPLNNLLQVQQQANDKVEAVAGPDPDPDPESEQEQANEKENAVPYPIPEQIQAKNKENADPDPISDLEQTNDQEKPVSKPKPKQKLKADPKLDSSQGVGKRKRKVVKENFEKNFVKLESEDLNLTSDQMKLLDLFEVSFKKPKGNREFFLQREISRLKDIKPIYREVPITNTSSAEDLDVCPIYGESVETQEDETLIWRQIDIKAMKEVKKRIVNKEKPEPKLESNSVMIEMDGKKVCIGERNLGKKQAIETLNDGKVRIIYHGEFTGAHFFVLDLCKGGTFVQHVEKEKVVSIFS